LTGFGIDATIGAGGIMKYLMISLVLLLSLTAFAQDKTQDLDGEYYYPPPPPAHYYVRTLIDKPTAYMLPRGAFDLDFKTFPGGGMQAAINIGLANRFSLGLAYGGAQILSEQTPEWNPKMEFNIKYMLIEEYQSIPQVTFGFRSAGYGLYQETDSSIGYHEDRYLVKSPGFFMAVSKEYPVYSSYVSLHGGISYSLENEIDSDPNIYIGSLINLGYRMVFLTEYDFALNDNKSAGIFGRGRGYLNIGVAWYLTSELQLELDFRNILLNRRALHDEDLVIDREIRLVYLQFFTD
jgi:hypothetical protein